MDTKAKILLVFDMDYTILQEVADLEVIKLLPPVKIEESRRNWANYMQMVYIMMNSHNIKIEQIKNVVENIPLNEGFPEIFEFIRQNKEKFETLIVSGANTLYIQWLIQFRKLEEVIDGYFSNYAEPSEEMLIKIRPNHEHACVLCRRHLSQCKKKILEEYITLKRSNNKDFEYSSIVYVGDGENDFCPSTILGVNDLLFPREEFELHHMITRGKHEKLSCKIHPWKSGNKVLEIIKKKFFFNEQSNGEEIN